MRNTLLFIISITLLLIASSCNYKRKITATNLTLEPIYGSNMVFKRGDTITIKGTCNSNGVLAIKLQDGVKYVTSDEKGKWEVNYPPISYKGKFNISVEGLDNTIELTNVTIGQVWVVFGDNWLGDTREELYGNTYLKSHGANSEVRVFNPNLSYTHENNSTIGNWSELKSDSKEYRELFVNMLGDNLATFYDEPIGIINLAWPGICLKDLSINETAPISALKPERNDSLWLEYFENLSHYQQLVDSSFKGLDRNVLDRKFDDWEWSDIDFPIITRKKWFLKNRIVWLRKKIFVASKYITSNFEVDFGTIRGQFDFYFNGVHIDRFSGEREEYKLHIPDTLVQVWTNLITVRMVAGDSLSGFYNEYPKVVNLDSTYRMGVAEDWKIRTYYEPTLPIIRKNPELLPGVYHRIFDPYGDISTNGVVIAGGIHQFTSIDEKELTQVLERIKASFVSEEYYMYLLAKPSPIEMIVISDYYNSIRNMQLELAAQQKWDVVNTLDVVSFTDEKQEYLQFMAEKLLLQLNP